MIFNPLDMTTPQPLDLTLEFKIVLRRPHLPRYPNSRNRSQVQGSGSKGESSKLKGEREVTVHRFRVKDKEGH